MEQKYWLKRQRSALGMARGAEAAETRLVHYEMAGLYSIMAAQSAGATPTGEVCAALPLPPRIARAPGGETLEAAR